MATAISQHTPIVHALMQGYDNIEIPRWRDYPQNFYTLCTVAVFLMQKAGEVNHFEVDIEDQNYVRASAILLEDIIRARKG